MRVRLILLTSLIGLGLGAACSSAPTPTLAPPTVISTSTQVKPDSDAIPTPSAVRPTSTPILQVTLITPTPLPTVPPPPPTALPSATSVFTPGMPVNPNAAAEATRAARPSELGSSAADAALVAVLRQCWNLSDTRQLNGNNPAHRTAFDCARQPLLNIVKQYPTYALVHRVLAWGYFYKDNDPQKAISSYRTAANLYKQAGNKTGESEARMRLALLLISSDQAQGCGELALAGNLDPTNERALDYYSAFNCQNSARRTEQGEEVAPPQAAQVNLAELRGKIVFKSDRDGFPAFYVMDPDGKNVQRISGATYEAAQQWESWSPDRTKVAIVQNAGFTRKFGYDNDIWITDPSGTGRPLTNPANDYDPAWSPVGLYDGRAWIAFVSNRGDIKHPENQGEEIWVMHDDGTNPARLTCNAPHYSKHPSWSPDATKIVFHSDYPDYRAQIYIMDVSAFGTLADNCQLGEGIVNISQSSSNDSEPIWVK